MADLFTNLAAQTLGIALLIEPLVPAQLANAPFVSEPALNVADHDSASEHEAQPNSDQPVSSPRPLAPRPFAPQPFAPRLQPDRTSASSELTVLAQPKRVEHQTNLVMTDNGEAALAIHQTEGNVSHQPAPREVSQVSRQHASAPAREHASDLRATSTTQPRPDKLQQARSSDRQAISAHEPPPRLVPLLRSSDVTPRGVDVHLVEQRMVQARSNSNAIEAAAASAQINDRAISSPARENSAGTRVSIELPTDAQAPIEKTVSRSHADRSHYFPIDHGDQIDTLPLSTLFRLIIQPEQARRANALVQPRSEPVLETLRLTAPPAQQMSGDNSTRPTIHVSIGRVEVRSSQTTTPMPARTRLTSSRPHLSLNDYLRRRGGAR